ncbi:MAG TPA: InlB B-repeat-containing protein [Propionicimonas sp.]|nr:InlB B-repeat-containing protein [Propionicimonas sp.]
MRFAAVRRLLLIVSLIVGLQFAAAPMLPAAQAAEEKVTVVFWPNGGNLDTATKTVSPGAKIGALPVPTRSRYVFVGWSDRRAHGGTLISASTLAPSVAGTVTYFARWAPRPVYQFDKRWANARYRNTVRGSGCGLTAATILVRSLGTASGSYQVTPATAAKWSLRHGFATTAPGKTKDPFFTQWPATYGVTLTRLNKRKLQKLSSTQRRALHAKARAAVAEGNWVLAFMKPGNWTQHGHFIVWYDTAGSRALVRDPNATKPAKTRAKTSLLQSQVWRYWIVKVPPERKLFVLP